MDRTRDCEACGVRTLSPQIWDGEVVCPACYFHERNLSDRLTYRESIAICEDRRICVYCGEPADEREHVVPRCANFPTWIVPACGECNRAAGGMIFDGIVAKKRHIQKALARRYAKVLRTPEWDASELDEMGVTMRRAIADHLAAKRIVQGRVRWRLPGEV